MLPETIVFQLASNNIYYSLSLSIYIYLLSIFFTRANAHISGTSVENNLRKPILLCVFEVCICDNLRHLNYISMYANIL
jgi:hypothetical protein